MANFCNYEIKVKGNQISCLAVFHSMPYLNYKDFDDEKRVGKEFLVTFTGDCKWSVNYGVNDNNFTLNLEGLSEDEMQERISPYYDYSLRSKSKAFNCEIMVHYWSEESGFDQFDYYKNGKLLKRRKIAFNYEEENEFDWSALEFVGHEGEYDESVDGEEQDQLFMNTLLGTAQTLANPISDESEEDPIDEEKLEEISNNLGDLLDQIENLFKENGIDLDDGSIGETGYDMYDWTFSEGKTVKGNGWTIAIPDGFKKIDSSEADPITGEKRLFELIPCLVDNSDNVDAPIRILSGASIDGQGFGANWMVHPEARSGYARAASYTLTDKNSQLFGLAPNVFSTAWSDVAAYGIIQETGGGTYSFQCVIVTENKNHQLRIQTQFIREKQKYLLEKSICNWLHTMSFNKANKACPKKTIFEEDSCFNELIKGKTKKFEKAIAQAKDEYNAAVALKILVLQGMAEKGLLDSFANERVKEILELGMNVKLFYAKKANDLYEKLLTNLNNDLLLIKLIDSLTKLEDDDLLDFEVDGEKIKIDVPKELKDIRKTWSKKRTELKSIEKELKKKADLEKRVKKEAELKRKKEEAEKKDAKNSIDECDSVISDAEKLEAILVEELKSIKKEIDAAKEALESQKTSRVNAVIKKYEDSINKVSSLIDSENAEIEKIMQENNNLNSEFSSLGFFALSRKSEIKYIISKNELRLKDIRKQVDNYKTELDKINNKKIQELSDLEKEKHISDDYAIAHFKAIRLKEFINRYHKNPGAYFDKYKGLLKSKNIRGYIQRYICFDTFDDVEIWKKVYKFFLEEDRMLRSFEVDPLKWDKSQHRKAILNHMYADGLIDRSKEGVDHYYWANYFKD